MTKIDDDRAPLDKALANSRNTLLVLSGSDATAAGAIHEVAEANLAKPWFKVFWIRDISVLTQAELSDENAKLFARGGRYAVIGRCTAADGTLRRTVVARGNLSDLLNGLKRPDKLAIKSAFAEGDLKRSCES